MGDILHALPAITALRRAHPSWKIGWAIEPRWQALLATELDQLSQAPLDIGNTGSDGTRVANGGRSEARPLVDQIHLVPSKVWGRNPLSRETLDGIRLLRAELRAAEYEAVLDLQGAIRSSVVARLSGCRRIVGEAKPREAAAKWLFHERVETAGAHVIEQDVELASAVAGDLLMPMAPALPVSLQAEEWCEALPELRAARWTNKPVVLIHPGAGWGAKRWPASRYGAVAEEFATRGATVVVNAGPGEEALAAQVVEAAHGLATMVRSSLEQLIELTRRVSMVIGGDTGPLHLACALGKPVVGIYGPTDPQRNGPYGSLFRVLRNPDSRRDHTRREQPEAGLLTITPEAVMAAAAELLLARRHGRPIAGWSAHTQEGQR